ncbi:MAG: class I SAM-dependent methyltransferase [Bacteroidota bacterium]
MSEQEKNISHITLETSSFRDPSGFVFSHDNILYRAVAPSYFETFSALTKSGLYKSLSSKNILINHDECLNFLPSEYSSYKIIKPEKISFISYPYEWCFGQLKSAALLTLSIMHESLEYGMILKDASAYNIQFIGNKPIFIDTLSFEKYEEGTPWIAYRQFCQHFLSPLALMCYKNLSLSKLLQIHIDGIPLALTSSLLPGKTIFNSGIALHIHFHAKIQNAYQKKKSNGKGKKFHLSKKKLFAMLEHLKETISDLKLPKDNSIWKNYHSENLYSQSATKEKSKIISQWLNDIKAKTIWDIGCNTGEYSILASKFCEYLLALDSDEICIERLYHQLNKDEIKNILPLVIDITNPTPPIGWANEERKTLIQRGKPDLIMALALIHHLRITHNIPLQKIAHLFYEWAEWLIVEFIPKEDTQVQEMLMNRKDIFTDYKFDFFLSIFSKWFDIIEQNKLPDSERILCLMKRKFL